MKKLLLTGAAAVALLTGCSSYTGTDNMDASKNATFALIPFVNHSNTPLAEQNVKAIVNSVLTEKGAKVVVYENNSDAEDLKSLLDENHERKESLKWLSNVSYNYVITGSVDEWDYKAGLDGEPVVSVTIEIKDANNKSVFVKTGSRSGFGRESLNYSGQVVVSNIFDDLKLN